MSKRGNIYRQENCKCHTCKEYKRLTVVFSDHNIDDTDEVDIRVCVDCIKNGLDIAEAK